VVFKKKKAKKGKMGGKIKGKSTKRKEKRMESAGNGQVRGYNATKAVANTLAA